MDPEETLRMLLQRIEWFRQNVDAGKTDAAIAEAELMATELEGLDRWLSRKGFLPKRWAR